MNKLMLLMLVIVVILPVGCDVPPRSPATKHEEMNSGELRAISRGEPFEFESIKGYVRLDGFVLKPWSGIRIDVSFDADDESKRTEGCLFLVAAMDGHSQKTDLFMKHKNTEINIPQKFPLVSIKNIFDSGLNGNLIMKNGEHEIKVELVNKDGKIIFKSTIPFSVQDDIRVR